jgi:hypothetical protein
VHQMEWKGCPWPFGVQCEGGAAVCFSITKQILENGSVVHRVQKMTNDMCV